MTLCRCNANVVGSNPTGSIVNRAQRVPFAIPCPFALFATPLTIFEGRESIFDGCLGICGTADVAAASLSSGFLGSGLQHVM